MLKAVSISNVAVIKSLSLDLEDGFTVITGETGAGKSIMIDSIAFVLGAKGSKDMIRTGEERAEVTALFAPSDEKGPYLSELGIFPDENGELLLSRSVTEDGKTTAKINGKSVSVSVLRQVSKALLTIHGQQDSGILSEKSELRGLLDSYVGMEKELSDFLAVYNELCENEKKLEDLKGALSDREMMIDILEYQLKEIDGAKLSDPAEEDKLLKLRSKLRSIEKISKSVSVVKRALSDNEKGVTAAYMLEKAASAVRSLTDVLDDAENMAEKLDAYKSEIIDIAERVSDILESDGMDDPERQLDLVEKRLSVIRKMTKKYGATVGEVLEKRDEIKSKLSTLKDGDFALEDLENSIKEIRNKAAGLAEIVSEKRKEAAAGLNEKICFVLRELDMPKVAFEIRVEPRKDKDGECIFDSAGYDDVDFYVSPNVGEDMLPISKIASGGELSRIMLAIKSCMLVKSGEGTSVFDEIDAGVSGATSERIGRKLSKMSDTTQIICITHSAQIAALADCHIKISKHEKDGRVESALEYLDTEGRVSELSRIIGGINITEKQIKTAYEMLEKSGKYNK